MTNYNDGKWHGWNGGECPVHPKTEVEALWVAEDGGYSKVGPKAAKDIAWKSPQTGSTHDCVSAFRVTKENREPREWWMVDSEAFDSPELAKQEICKWGLTGKEIVHVREVI